MISKHPYAAVAIMFTALVFSSLAHAHSGGTDDEGCHFDRSNNTRHCHDESAEYERYLVKIDKVVDGDTVYIKKPIHGVTKVRLDAIDTPEIFSSKCEREKTLGMVAKGVAEDFLDGGDVYLITNGKKGKYGRLIARLEVGGQDYGQNMLSQGMAVRYTQSWIDTPKDERWCKYSRLE
ncbi:MAG: thermonuclease family protein [Alphaproteobacteria bacterium]